METNRATDLRIGIPIIGNRDWLGGVHYVNSIVKAVHSLPRNERARIFLLIDEHTLATSELHRDVFALLDGIIFFGRNIRHAKTVLKSPLLHYRTPEGFSSALDFLYPLVADVVPNLCSGSWIYDFQHVHLPEFFSQDEINARNTKFRRVAETAKLVILSSRNAEHDFWRIFPESKAVTRVLSFHSLPSEDWLTPDPSETQRKYSLPDKFFICCNQFWIHKNHKRLFEAITEIFQVVPDGHLVCTGSTSDWRFEDYFPELISFIENRGLRKKISILGIIPRADQIQLMRRSLAVIQPSLFEGWSSVVEESRMLGKTVFLSDLEVHHEQAPDHAVYFDRFNAKDLAQKILAALPNLKAGPDHLREREAQKKAVELVKDFGRTFCSIAEEAQRLFGKTTFRRNEGPLVPPAAECLKDNGTRLPSGKKGYPKISIVTPSFNQGRFLEECIDSILGQNYPNLEYVIMDGGSTDNSVEIIRKYEKYLTFWQSKPDGGQYQAVNDGFKKTTGGIMGWLNSDDKLHSCALRNIAAIFSVRDDVEWIMGRPTWWTEDGGLKDVWHKRETWTRKKYLDGDYKWIQQESSYWRRSLWNTAGGCLSTNFALAGDLELWARFFRLAQLHFVDALIGGFREYGGMQKTHLSIDRYLHEAEQVIERERAFYANNPKALLEAPPAITVKEVEDYLRTCGFNRGITIVAPSNYTNKSWFEEAKRIFGEDADIAILSPPSGEGFESIRFRENTLFLGSSHHLPGLFDSDGKIRFWNNIPSKKYFYQYERTIDSYWKTNLQKEKQVHKINAEAYAVQDEYDAASYGKVFGASAVWLPDMVSAHRVQCGTGYPPLSARPIDLLFIGKMSGDWYRQRREVLARATAYADANGLRAVITDTSARYLGEQEIERHYAQAKLVINPIGSGQFFNVRFLEALSAGCVCLQQAEKDGHPLRAFQERYRDYNAVYFTSRNLEEKMGEVFSDIKRFEVNVPNTHSLLLRNDTGQARFAALGICTGTSVIRREEHTATPLPVHFFTIVLNGEPFIRHHIEVFKQLPFMWHWHIVEGVADLKHDTAWSLPHGARITADLHRKGLSNDGTTEYLDALAAEFPEHLTVYRKKDGTFWDGKLEMVNAPLPNIKEECLLWQVDVDELWTIEQLCASHTMFMQQPERTAAYYYCHYFVGEDLVITTRNTYGNYTSYEWLRTWRYTPGDRWDAHEPPRLFTGREDGTRVDVGRINPFTHDETERRGLVFQHYAYATENQLYFKERYFGYAGAVIQWKRLQQEQRFPVPLRDYFAWVKDRAMVNTATAAKIPRLAEKGKDGTWRFAADLDERQGAAHVSPDHPGKQPGSFAPPSEHAHAVPKRVLWVRSDSIGDHILAGAMLPHLRTKYPEAKLIVMCQEHIAGLYEACPFADEIITFDKDRLYRDASYRDSIQRRMQRTHPDVALNSVFSREPVTDFLAIENGAQERIAFRGDLANGGMTAEIRDRNNQFYSRLLESDKDWKPELERHADFLAGLGIEAPPLAPAVWTNPEDGRFAEAFFRDNGLESGQTIALFAGAQQKERLSLLYGTALSEICKDRPFTLIALGAEQDRDINQRNLDAVDTRTLNLSGSTTLRQTAALLRRCRLAVGAETGTAHIASAVGTPHVVLLGGGFFGRFMPYSPLTTVVCLPLECYGCYWRCKYGKVHCMNAISPEVFTEAIRQTLAGTSEKPRVFVQGTSMWKPGTGQPRWKWFTEYLDLDSVEIVPAGDVPAAPGTADSKTEETAEKKIAPLPAPSKKEVDTGCDVSIVLATKDRASALDEMLSSIANAAGSLKYEVIVIAGDSADDTAGVLRRHKITRIFQEREALGQGKHTWPELYNFGFSKARGRWGMYASDDIVFERGCLAKAVAMLDGQPPQVAGGVFFYKDLYPESPGWGDFGISFTLGQHLLMNYGLVRMDFFRDVQGLDERYRFYQADADLSLKAVAKRNCFIPLPESFLLHKHRLESKKEIDARYGKQDTELLIHKWSASLPVDMPFPSRLMYDEESLPAFDLPRHVRPSDIPMRDFWHGIAWLQKEQYQKAADKLMPVMSSCSHWIVVWYVAQALIALGRTREGKRGVEFVVKSAPGFAEAGELLALLNAPEDGPESTAYDAPRTKVRAKKKLVIHVRYGGLGDHLFYSHLPRIAKETGAYDEVYVSNMTEFRHPDYKRMIWEMNPYVDGFTDEQGFYPEFAQVERGSNILDKVMLLQGLDDGKRFHEPELYYQPEIIPELRDMTVYDPNFISYVGELSAEAIGAYLTRNKVVVDYQMKLRDQSLAIPDFGQTIESASLEHFCSIIVSCRRLYCLASGTATLAAALRKPATVFYGKGQMTMFHHSRMHTYVLPETPSPRERTGGPSGHRRGKDSLFILHTADQYPPDNGETARAVQMISEGLVRRGHYVEIATAPSSGREHHELNGVVIREFELQGNLVSGIRGNDLHRYQDFLLESEADVVVNFGAGQWATDLAYNVLDATRKRRVNILAPRGYPGLADAQTRVPQSERYFTQMVPLAVPQYDAAVYASSADADYEYAQRHGFHNSVVIPDGITGAQDPNESAWDAAIDLYEALYLRLHRARHEKGKQESTAYAGHPGDVEMKLVVELRTHFRDVTKLLRLAELAIERSALTIARNYLIAAMALEPQNEQVQALWAKLHV